MKSNGEIHEKWKRLMEIKKENEEMYSNVNYTMGVNAGWLSALEWVLGDMPLSDSSESSGGS